MKDFKRNIIRNVEWQAKFKEKHGNKIELKYIHVVVCNFSYCKIVNCMRITIKNNDP